LHRQQTNDSEGSQKVSRISQFLPPTHQEYGVYEQTIRPGINFPVVDYQLQEMMGI